MTISLIVSLVVRLFMSIRGTELSIKRSMSNTRALEVKFLLAIVKFLSKVQKIRNQKINLRPHCVPQLSNANASFTAENKTTVLARSDIV